MERFVWYQELIDLKNCYMQMIQGDQLSEQEREDITERLYILSDVLYEISERMRELEDMARTLLDRFKDQPPGGSGV